MNLPLVYRPEVRDEINGAHAWYEQQRKGLGEEFLGELRLLLNRVQQNPEIYAVIHRNARAALLRRFPYVVYYRIEPDRIVVLAIQHGKKHPRGWQSRA